MITDQGEHAIKVVREELIERLTSVWAAYLIGESRDVQQRIVDDCANFLFAQLPLPLVAEMLFRQLMPEAEVRARRLVAQIPREDGQGRIVITYEPEDDGHGPLG